VLALLVEDNRHLLTLQELLLQEAGFVVMSAESAEVGLAIAKRQAFCLAVVDYHLPGMNGAQLACALKRLTPGIRILLLSGSGEIPPADLECADAFLMKGHHEVSELLTTIRRLLQSK
jgi:DNA-binding response OmpR family regulator